MEWESYRITHFIVYAPDSSYDDVVVEDFFGTLQHEMNLLPPTDKIVLLVRRFQCINRKYYVENSIKRLSNRKAPAIDGITSELIKAGGDIMI